jgi:hypothetical protein
MYTHNFRLCINAYPKTASIQKNKLYISSRYILTIDFETLMSMDGRKTLPLTEGIFISKDYLSICLVMCTIFFSNSLSKCSG